MEIKSQIEYNGKIYTSHYVEKDQMFNLPDKVRTDGAHAICFYGDKIIVVYNDKKDHWTYPGGGVEKGETFEQATVREVKEESNMKVLHHEFIGYQDLTDETGKTYRQSHSFCIVEPYGDFESDPDGDILEIKLIDPKDYKEYIKWGDIGDHLIERAIEMKNMIK